MIQTIERSIRNHVAEILKVPAEHIDATKPLARLGVDSLGMLQLTATLESDMGVEWPAGAPPSQLTIASLATLLHRSGTSGTLTAREVMLADSVLPPDIQPDEPRCAASATSPQRILLTGATGFLGAHLVSSLLSRNDGIEIVCLVRPGSGSALQRVRKNLSRYGIWDDCFEGRIQALSADLTQPRLGLPPSTFNALTQNIDAIFHSAASVNWIQSYSTLRLTNVLPLRELLRLACRAKPKPFHFVSTLGVCYSSCGPREIDETSDAFRDLDGIPLAYAQSKLVAENLVRTANQRGLPATIFRPSFISGDSTTGISPTSDFVSSLIKGCIQMSAAPDLDWVLDAIPVDFTAKVISHLSLLPSEELRVFHLANPKPRHWRELILWMNFYGYPVHLVTYGEWLTRLEKIEDPEFALRTLMPFFQQRLPQHYEESVRRRVRHDLSDGMLRAHEQACPEFSVTLIDRYFSAFVEQDFLTPPGKAPTNARASTLTSDFEAIFGGGVESVEPIDFKSSGSVINELTSWKHGNSFGLHAHRVKLRGRDPIDVVLKVKATDDATDEIGQTIAGLCGPELESAYARYSDRLGIRGANAREVGIYRETDERLRRFLPYFHGALADDTHAALALEHLSNTTLMNAVDRIEDWTPAYINAAIDGLGEIHSVWYGHERDLLRRPWLGPHPTLQRMEEALPLWSSLSDHAAPIFSRWGSGDISWTRIEGVAHTWACVEQMPRTLIHNDFNPRNITFRRDGNEVRLCVYDWELATLGVPQHDLAELLCFVLGADARADDVCGYVERHRQVLAAFSGRSIDRALWIEGFRLSLQDLMIQRLPAYAMIHRFQRQPFLERVVRTWRALYGLMEQ